MPISVEASPGAANTSGRSTSRVSRWPLPRSRPWAALPSGRSMVKSRLALIRSAGVAMSDRPRDRVVVGGHPQRAVQPPLGAGRVGAGVTRELHPHFLEHIVFRPPPAG